MHHLRDLSFIITGEESRVPRHLLTGSTCLMCQVPCHLGVEGNNTRAWKPLACCSWSQPLSRLCRSSLASDPPAASSFAVLDPLLLCKPQASPLHHFLARSVDLPSDYLVNQHSSIDCYYQFLRISHSAVVSPAAGAASGKGSQCPNLGLTCLLHGTFPWFLLELRMNSKALLRPTSPPALL